MVFVDTASAEAQYQLVDSALTAEQIFDARWAGTLIEGALARLQAEMDQAGKRPLYDQISGFVLADDESSYHEVAQRSGLTLSAIKTAIHRLRSRYRALLRDEIARTVTSSADFDEELRALRSSLVGRRYRR